MAALVVRQGLTYAFAASVVGVPLALAASRVMRGVLFGVGPHDPATVIVLCAAVALATVAATLAPAHRARRIAPAAVLKGD